MNDPTPRVLPLLVMLILAMAGRCQDERVLSRARDIDKAPRLSGDWVCWTSDLRAIGSTGSVFVKRVSTGESWCLGTGFLPDIEATDGVRVAFLRFLATGSLEVCSARFAGVDAGAPWTVDVLAHDLPWADHVRVRGDVTVWSAADDQGVPRIFAARPGAGAVILPSDGPAFRPELVRDSRGRILCAWDVYLAEPGVFDYEVFLSTLDIDGRWSAPRNLSEAPRTLDMAPSLAADRDGSVWVAWETDRGGICPRAFVEKLQPDGTVLLPPCWPPDGDPGLAADPEEASDESDESGESGEVGDSKPEGAGLPAEARRGTVFPVELRDVHDPCLVLDGAGRPWLFVSGQTAGNDVTTVFNKQLRYLVLGEAGWLEPRLVSEGTLDEIALAGQPVADDPLAVQVVYQITSRELANVEIAERTLRMPAATDHAADDPGAGQPLLLPPAGSPPLRGHIASPLLPRDRRCRSGAGGQRLLIADLHCHTRYSPDGVGERDVALFSARDVMGLDAVAITDHDDRFHEPFTDWEYEQGRRFMELFDTPRFAAIMGFEWTDDRDRIDGEVVGHRACFDSSCCYRYTDGATSTLPRLDAALRAEDAIGVPHHLGKFGGATFRVWDAVVQPVTEVSSLHGVFEAELWSKLLEDGARVGVTAAGDNHCGSPGNNGLAGLWVEVGQGNLHAAIKEALRARRCFGVKRHALSMDFHLEDVPMGGVIRRQPGEAGPLHLDVWLGEVPRQLGVTRFNVNLVRDGDVAHPVWQRAVQPGEDLTVTGVELPAPERSAIYMLRVSRGGGSGSPDTIAWSSPIWIDVGAAEAGPADAAPGK